MADPNAPADANPFDFYDKDDAAFPSAAAPKHANAFDFYDNDDSKPKTSTFGAFATGAATGIIPAAAGLMAAGPGAEAGAALGLLGGPYAPFTVPAGGLIGGAAAMIGASYGAGKAQDYALSKLPDSWRDALDQQREAAEKEHPIASFLGGLVPYAVTMTPMGAPAILAKLPENATTFMRLMAHPLTKRLFPGAIMGGMELGQEAATDPSISWPKVAISTGFGVVFNHPTRIGEAITNIGTPATHAAIEAVAPGTQARVARAFNPTIAQAADAKIMGTGITESVSRGTEQMAPQAEMTANEAARTEQGLIGPPAPDPNIHDVARRLAPETIDRYRELRADEDTFRHWMASAADTTTGQVAERHLAATMAEMRKIEPDVAAAYRRAQEATGTAVVEPEGHPEQFKSFAEMLAARDREAAPAATPEAPGTKPELTTDRVTEEPGTIQKPAAAPESVPFAAVGVGASEGAPTPQPAPRSIEQQRDFIAQDVARQLIAAGRPQSEALASGQLVAARYEARAARFGGKLGTAEDLYRKEGAEIRGGRGAGAAATGAQPRPQTPPAAEAPKIDTSKDVVSGANSSKDGKTVYIDPRIPQLSPTLKDKTGNPANLHKYLVEHETEEGKAMAEGLPYDKAHIRATQAERALVEADGVDWKAYTEQMDGYLSSIEHEKAVNPPTDTHVDPQAAIGHHHSSNKTNSIPETVHVAARPARQVNENALSLLAFLAHRGGIRADDANIADLRSSVGENKFMPGFGSLIRSPRQLSTAAERGGASAPMYLDRARIAAAEASYLPMDSTVADFLGLIDKEARGQKVYQPGYEREAAASERPEDEFEAAAPLSPEQVAAEEQETARLHELMGGVELFQRDQAPPFYSAVARAVESAKQEKASPQQWLATIKNTQGVKSEEMEWLGLEDWLKQQKGSVTRQEVADYIRANAIGVKEVEKGRTGIVPREEQERLHAAIDELVRDGHLTARHGYDLFNQAWEGDAKAIGDLEGLGISDEIISPFRDRTTGGPAKFGQYTLPGGENYRELLLTLPGGVAPLEIKQLPDGNWGHFVNGERVGSPYPSESAARIAASTDQRTINALGQARNANLFRSSHWDEPNVLAHIRFDDRTIDGKRTLHIAEVQSDWHQKGRKQGYARDTKGWTAQLLSEPDAGFTHWQINDANGTPVTRIIGGTAESAIRKAAEGVPDAPFKTTWPELSLKRMIRYAAENGYEQISWDTGETNAQRYDLSKQVRAVTWKEETGELQALALDGRTIDLPRTSRDQLADRIGKEAAEKIIKEEENLHGFKTLQGEGLKVGGEGMRGFYDQILPAAANKLVKKFGARVGEGEVSTGKKAADAEIPENARAAMRSLGNLGFDRPGEAWAALREDMREGRDIHQAWDLNQEQDRDAVKAIDEYLQSSMERKPVHTLPLTPELRDAATEQGFPLFQGAQGKINLIEGRRPIITLMKSANASTFVHESGHQWLEELMRDAAHPLAPDDLKADAATVRNWLGVGENGGIKTREHEKFARSFEQYLRAGIAPSPELASVFAKFKAWLLRIYDTVRKLGEPINDDIKGVFDRMLASEPQRTVIAPERQPEMMLANIHENDAVATEPHEAEAHGDLITAEATRYVTEPPADIAHDIATASAEAEQAIATARAGAEPAGEAGPGASAAAEVEHGGGQPEPVAEGGGVGAERGPVVPGGGGPLPEGDRLAGERGGAKPDAGPAPAESAGNQQQPQSQPHAFAPGPAATLERPESRLVGKEGNIRAENITSKDELIQAVNESSDRLVAQGRTTGRLTMGEMVDAANDILIDPASISETELAAMFGGLHQLSSKIWALRTAIKQSAGMVSAAMEQAARTNDAVDLLKMWETIQRHDMMQSVLSGVTTETGRGTGMGFRNMEGWEQVEGLDTILQQAKVQELTGRTLFQLQMVAKMGAKLDTPAKVSKFLRDAQKRSFGGMILEYWINGLISGIATHMTYFTGNNLMTAERMVATTPVAAAIGALRAASRERAAETAGLTGEARHAATSRVRIGGQLRGLWEGLPAAVQGAGEGLRTGLTTLLPGEQAHPLLPFAGDNDLVIGRSLTNDPVTWGEVRANLYGVFSGLKDSILATGKLIAAGGVEGAPLMGLEYSPRGQIPDLSIRGVTVPLGSAIRAPGNMIAAIHSFHRILNYSILKNNGAVTAAMNEGLTGERLAARTAELRQNPTEDQMKNYVSESAGLTLMQQGGEFVRRLSALTNWTPDLPVLGKTKVLKFIDPFVQISAQIIDKAIVERTPVGLLSSEIRADLMGKNGNIAQDMASAKMLVGSAFALTFMGLAASGYASGSGPKDPRKNMVWRLAGNQAHSVRIGDTWYDVHRLGPMGMLMGVAADMYDVAHEAGQGELTAAAASLVHGFAQNILDESSMRGPADLIQAIEDSDRHGPQYIRNFLSSFVPFSVGMAQMARAADPYSRQARTLMDTIYAKVPGLSEQLLPRLDVWGEPMPSMDALGHAGVTAIYERKVSTDPVNLALFNLGIAPAQIERSIRNVPLTDLQYDDFSRIAGRMAKMRLDAIVRSPDYQSWPNHIRHDVIVETIRQSREAARGIMMMKYPQIPRDATAAKLAKLNGTTP